LVSYKKRGEEKKGQKKASFTQKGEKRESRRSAIPLPPGREKGITSRARKKKGKKTPPTPSSQEVRKKKKKGKKEETKG